MVQKCWRKLPILDEMSKNGQVQDAFSTTSDQHNDPIFAEHIVHGSKNPPEKEACKNIHPLGQDESPKGANLTRQAANLTRHDGTSIFRFYRWSQKNSLN